MRTVLPPTFTLTSAIRRYPELRPLAAGSASRTRPVTGLAARDQWLCVDHHGIVEGAFETFSGLRGGAGERFLQANDQRCAFRKTRGGGNQRLAGRDTFGAYLAIKRQFLSVARRRCWNSGRLSAGDGRGRARVGLESELAMTASFGPFLRCDCTGEGKPFHRRDAEGFHSTVIS